MNDSTEKLVHVSAKDLVINKTEKHKLVASELVYALLKYISDESLEEAIFNGDLDISEEELMRFKRNGAQEEFVYNKDFGSYRIETWKNANGHFFKVLNYSEINVPEDELYNSADSFEYFDSSEDAWIAGRDYINENF